MISVEIESRMLNIQRYDFLNHVLLVIVKNLKIEITDKVKVHFVSIISDAHHTGTMLIKQADLPVKCLPKKIGERDHEQK